MPSSLLALLNTAAGRNQVGQAFQPDVRLEGLTHKLFRLRCPLTSPMVARHVSRRDWA